MQAATPGLVTASSETILTIVTLLSLAQVMMLDVMLSSDDTSKIIVIKAAGRAFST